MKALAWGWRCGVKLENGACEMKSKHGNEPT